jgi:hypothetical protein
MATALSKIFEVKYSSPPMTGPGVDGGDLGRSESVKRPGTAWKTLIHDVVELVLLCMAAMTWPNRWPMSDGQGRACERTLTWARSRVSDSMAAECQHGGLVIRRQVWTH